MYVQQVLEIILLLNKEPSKYLYTWLYMCMHQ